MVFIHNAETMEIYKSRLVRLSVEWWEDRLLWCEEDDLKLLSEEVFQAEPESIVVSKENEEGFLEDVMLRRVSIKPPWERLTWERVMVLTGACHPREIQRGGEM